MFGFDDFELEANSLVTEEFRASIFSREKMGNTNLESGVALPHANPSMVIESNIFIVALKMRLIGAIEKSN